MNELVFDDDLFSTRTPRKPPPPTAHYTAQHDTSLHFVTDEMESAMDRGKPGYNQVKSNVDYYYYTRQYDKALSLTLRMITYRQQHAQPVLGELYETAARCYHHLNDTEQAYHYASQLTTSDPGTLLFKAQMAYASHRHVECVDWYKAYMTVRGVLDYAAWRDLSHVYHTLKDDLLAQQCAQFSISILQQSVVQGRLQRQLVQLQEWMSTLSTTSNPTSHEREWITLQFTKSEIIQVESVLSL
jgi:tetratricopeptide (TPR) repeat protein